MKGYIVVLTGNYYNLNAALCPTQNFVNLTEGWKCKHMKSATDSNTDGQTSINIVITLSVSNLYVSIYMDRDYEIT